MLVGISGNICAGKSTVCRYLVLHGFKYLYVIAAQIKQEQLPDIDNQLEHFHHLQLLELGRRDTSAHQMGFKTIDELIHYATVNWNSNFVTDVHDLATLELLAKRPFFLHVAIDAPARVRWTRHFEKETNALSFEDFVILSDEYMYNPEAKGAVVINRAQVVVINGTESLELLYVSLDKLNLLDQTRLRPSWDAYFMRLADLAALRSNCMKRRVGCVLVRDRRVIATGYNGTPRGLTNCNEGGCTRCNSGNGSGSSLTTCLCLHAEENALLEAGRDRLGSKGILYCNTCPCLTCSIKIVQSGMQEVVYSQSYSMDDASADVLRSGGILLRQYSPPSEGIVL